MQDVTIEDLDLSLRTYHCLKWKGINFKSELENMTEKDFYRIRNFCQKSLDEIKSKVKLKGSD